MTSQQETSRFRCRAARVAIFVASLALAPWWIGGCATSSTEGSATTGLTEAAVSDAKILTGRWILRSIDGTSIAESVDEWERPPSLSFREDGQVAGFMGVNQMGSQLDRSLLRDGVFKLGPMRMTLMAGPPDRMSFENRYVRALERCTAAAIDDDTLQLTAGESAVLVFQRDQ